jgi:hypothetical protein
MSQLVEFRIEKLEATLEKHVDEDDAKHAAIGAAVAEVGKELAVLRTKLAFAVAGASFVATLVGIVIQHLWK